MNINSKYRNWLTMIAAVVLVVVIGVTMGGRSKVTWIENLIGSIVTPIQIVVHNMGSAVGDKVNPLIEVWHYKDENAQLKAENEKLNKELIEATLTSQELNNLKELRASLNYAASQNINNYITCDIINYITSDIIAKDSGNWYSMFVINAGSDKGVVKDSTVLCGDGLVGKVYEVGKDYAKVVSIIDNKGAVGFEILDPVNNYDGRVVGSIDGTLTGYLYDPKAVVRTGQKIITSGLGLYPRGILVGEIKEVIFNKDSLLKEVIVKPEVNFRNLERVFIIPQTSSFVE